MLRVAIVCILFTLTDDIMMISLSKWLRKRRSCWLSFEVPVVDNYEYHGHHQSKERLDLINVTNFYIVLQL